MDQRPQKHAPAHTRRTTVRPSSPRAAAPQTVRSPHWAPVIAICLVMVVGLLFAGMISGLQRCSSNTPPSSSGAYVSPYDWTGLTRDGDRFTYSENGTIRSQVGVDVSDHQGAIDWRAVANDGIDFAFVRAGNRGYTEGGLSSDTRFAENVEGAQAAGLEVGAYFFSQAINVAEAEEEADLLLSQLAGRKLALPIAFDHEPVADSVGRANNLDPETLTAAALAFCKRIEAAGYTTMVYGNQGDMARYDRAALGTRGVWFAEYDAATPGAQFDFAIWQYTSGGSVAGIATSVDLNLRMTDVL